MPTLTIQTHLHDNTFATKPYIYVDNPTSGACLRGVRFNITDPPASYDLEYSPDNGSTRYTVASGLTSATTTYTWYISEVDRAAIFGADLSIESSLFIVRSGGSDVATANPVLCLVSLPATSTPPAGATIYQNDAFVINYGETYESPTTAFNVKIKGTGSSTWLAVQDTLAKSIKSVPFNAATYKPGGSYLTIGASTQFHILVQGDGDHTGNWVIYPAFTITSNSQAEDQTTNTANAEFFNSDTFRVLGGRRVAAEKGELLDEAIVIGQLEADPSTTGLKIEMRDGEGKLVTGDSVNYKKAYNIKFSIDHTKLPIPVLGKELIQYITFGTFDSPSVANGQLDVTPIPNPYNWGKLYRKTLTHNFGNEVNLAVDIVPITNANTGSISNLVPAISSMAWWEPVDSNNIYVYCVIKDPDELVYGDLVAPSGDTYHFRVVMQELTEVAP